MLCIIYYIYIYILQDEHRFVKECELPYMSVNAGNSILSFGDNVSMRAGFPHMCSAWGELGICRTRRANHGHGCGRRS